MVSVVSFGVTLNTYTLPMAVLRAGHYAFLRVLVKREDVSHTSRTKYSRETNTIFGWRAAICRIDSQHAVEPGDDARARVGSGALIEPQARRVRLIPGVVDAVVDVDLDPAVLALLEPRRRQRRRRGHDRVVTREQHQRGSRQAPGRAG